MATPGDWYAWRDETCGLVIAVLLWTVPLLAVATTQQLTSRHPLEPSDTSTPAATLSSLIESCNQLQALIADEAITEERAEEVLPTTERILDCLDLSELPTQLRGTAGIESALFLKEVLDRVDLPANADIPAVDSEAEDSESQLRWQIPGTRIAIARVAARPYRNAYLFTPDTVRRAAEFYRMAKPLPYRSEGRSVSPGLYEAYIAATKKQPAQTADTSSPRGTLTLFLDACNELHAMTGEQRYFDRSSAVLHDTAQRALSCLDTSQLPDYARDYFDAEAAVCLKEVLDRIPLPPAEQVPGIEAVEATDGVQPLLRSQVPRTQIAIVRMEEGPRRGEYLFSPGTVSRAPQLYEKVKSQPYRTGGREVSAGLYEWWLASPGNPTVAAWVDKLPKWFQQRRFGVALWQWIGLMISIPLSLGLMLLIIRWARVRGEYVRRRSLWQYWLIFGLLIVVVCIPIGFKHFAYDYLTLRGSASYIVNFCADLVVLLGVLGLIVGGSSRLAESLIALPQVSPQSLDANLIRIICRVLGIVAAIIVFLEGGRYLGFPLTTLIASAGIGGLAIALSAQGLIKGLFGTVTILLDKPYRVGERIVVKGHDGIVEEIGLRSTKLRALSNHLIAIPNDQMADAEIENIGKRTHIRRLTDLHIPLDTRRDKVEEAVACIRAVLENHEGMDPEFPPRVYFNEFNPDSFNIRFIYWYTPPDLWRYYACCERVNLEIFRIFEQRGIQFSLPHRHAYWKHDTEQGPLEVLLSKEPD